MSRITQRKRDLTEKEQFWFDQGYVPISIAAEKAKVSRDTIDRAVRSKEIEFKQDGKQRFVSLKSLIKWLGPDVAKAYGLVAR